MQHSNPMKATAAIVTGMFVLGFTDNLVTLIASDFSLWMFHAGRSAMAVPMIGLMMMFGIGTLHAHRPLWVLARNFFTATALLIYFGCLAVLPIGVVVAGVYTAPIFVLILSMIFRNEEVGIWRWLAVACGFTGALLVVWPDEGGLSWLSALPVLAGLFYAIGVLGTRAWCEGEDTYVMTAAYFAILGVYGVIGLCYLTLWPVDAPIGPDGWAFRGYVTPSWTMWWVTFAQALGSIIGVVLLTRGYQLGEASYVAINEYSLIVFASLFAWIMWEQALSLQAIFGIALIILSGSVIALRSKG